MNIIKPSCLSSFCTPFNKSRETSNEGEEQKRLLFRLSPSSVSCLQDARVLGGGSVFPLLGCASQFYPGNVCHRTHVQSIPERINQNNKKYITKKREAHYRGIPLLNIQSCVGFLELCTRLGGLKTRKTCPHNVGD